MTLHSATPLFRIGSTRRHGQGAIATRPIQPGQLVHYEEPLVIQEDVRNSQSILSNLCAHPTAFTQAYLNLHNAFVESLPEDPILAIFNSNCLPLAPVEPVSRSLSDENGRILAHGVFLQLSRFNNSCTPNASITWDERRGRMTVHALEPIRAGDELTICYGQPLFAVRNERREYLRHLRNFTCTCACCEREDGDEEARKASDARRTELCRLFKAVPFLGHDAPAGIRAATQAIQTLHTERLNLYLDSFAFEAYQFCVLLRTEAHSNYPPSANRDPITTVMTINDHARQWIQRAYQWKVITSGRESDGALFFSQILDRENASAFG